MPITLSPGWIFGPGASISASSSVTEILPGPIHWELTVNAESDDPGFHMFFVIEDPSVQPPYSRQFDFIASKLADYQAVLFQNAKPQQPITVKLDIVDGNEFIADTTGEIHTTWQESAMLWRFNETTGTTTGGLTQEEHDAVISTNNGVYQIFQTAIGTLLSSPVGGLIAHPDQHFLNLHTPCSVVTGRGRLPPPGPVGFGNVYGILVTFLTIPAGFGKLEGNADEYTNRIVQLVSYFNTNDGGAEYITEIRDIRANNQVWMWQLYDPTAIGFDVTPGCEVQLCYLTVGG